MVTAVNGWLLAYDNISVIRRVACLMVSAGWRPAAASRGVRCFPMTSES